MEFKILHSYGKDAIYWNHLITKLRTSDRDIHFLPEYCQIYSATYKDKIFLAFYGNDKEFAIQPFLLKPINNFNLFINKRNKYYDLVNPYGFGGPLISASDNGVNLIKDYRLLINQFCKNNNIVSEFSCLHPLLQNEEQLKKAGIKIYGEKEIVYVNLLKTEKQLWKEIGPSHQRNILKAKQQEVLVKKVSLNIINLKIFSNLYYQTMNKHKAEKRWYFPKNYFPNCINLLGQRRISLFIVYVENKPAAAYLLIHDFRTIYYFLGGSDQKFYNYKPNNLLIYEIILWAKRKGFHYLHLGGGVGPKESDSLLRFKSGFSNTRKTLFSYRIIHNKAVYQKLSDKKKHNDLKLTGKISKSDYFPYYQQN